MALTALVMLPLAAPACVGAPELGRAHVRARDGCGGVRREDRSLLLAAQPPGRCRASSVNYLLPATAVLWGVLFLHETVTLVMIGGAVIILCGVLLTSLPRSMQA